MRIFRVCIIALTLLCGGFLFAETPSSWEYGKVVSSVLNGQGQRGSKSYTSSEWWTYCVSSPDRYYAVASTRGPAELGLLNSRQVRFLVKKNRFLIINPAGKQIALRMVRKNVSGTCR